ncbi:APC family permease [Poriferisphaera sp. WC338]|uniref:APC family permease n=1 Tax=Poriferisphaera sp. WC338 TaxID=3425129 RepID=UPI003D816D7D
MNAEQQSSKPSQTGSSLRREVGVLGAVMMGLGSIMGTGVFVSIGIAAGITGPSVVLAIALAALVAMCNAFSSAQLAASHPVSGGTYEYGYKYLHPMFGFSAGWMFLCAKSASAATAALGTAGYLLHIFNVDNQTWIVPSGLLAVVALTVIVLSGIRRSNTVNIIIVSITLSVLMLFVIFGLPRLFQSGQDHFAPFFDGQNGSSDFVSNMHGLFYATALMFVAYTGYGRIATLGEEVKNPRKTIPKAIVSTLVVSAIIYLMVSFVAIGAVGADLFGRATMAQAAPLEVVAASISNADQAISDAKLLPRIIAIGAVTAMLGVLLNLILGLSRVLLAMGRRADMPKATTHISKHGGTPTVSVVVVGTIIAGLVCTGSVKTTWTFSAFTVLVYYAITNLAALRLSKQDRLYPRIFSWCGLISCLFLAFWVEWRIWAIGLAILFVGLCFHKYRQCSAH